jgi:hypothetical protein
MERKVELAKYFFICPVCHGEFPFNVNGRKFPLPDHCMGMSLLICLPEQDCANCDNRLECLTELVVRAQLVAK